MSNSNLLGKDESIVWQTNSKIYSSNPTTKNFTVLFGFCSAFFITLIILFLDWTFISLLILIPSTIIIGAILTKITSNKYSDLKKIEYFLTNKRIGIINKGEIKIAIVLTNIKFIDIIKKLNKINLKLYSNDLNKKIILEYTFMKSSNNTNSLITALNSLIPLTQEYLEGGVRFVRKQN